MTPLPIAILPRMTDGRDDIELVKVFETSDRLLVSLVGGMLDEAGIDWITSGEGTQNLIGWSSLVNHSRSWTGKPLVRGVEFFVRKDDVPSAREILESLADDESR